jgi:predicted Fe-Mo cluster-binding NifX family protein
MKIAVTSLENNKDSKMDPRFGRGAFFAVYDSETKEFGFYENEAKDASGGAGPKAAEQIVNLGVNKLLSSDFGPKAKSALESMGVEMQLYMDKDKSVEQILLENIA